MLWQQCLQQLQQEIPDHEINTWLRALHAVENRQALYLLAPNTIVLQQVHEQYLPRILFHARILSGHQDFDVLLQIGSSTPTTPRNLNGKSSSAPLEVLSIREQSPPNQLSSAALAKLANPAPVSERFSNTLNPRMSFANFVQGKSNQLACAAAQQVGERDDSGYNPLFIYGGVGLGKTHLIHAIGNLIL